jgi:hypothetical protein
MEQGYPELFRLSGNMTTNKKFMLKDRSFKQYEEVSLRLMFCLSIVDNVEVLR